MDGCSRLIQFKKPPVFSFVLVLTVYHKIQRKPTKFLPFTIKCDRLINENTSLKEIDKKYMETNREADLYTPKEALKPKMCIRDRSINRSQISHESGLSMSGRT